VKRRDSFFAGLTFALLLALAWVVAIQPALVKAGVLDDGVVTNQVPAPAPAVTKAPVVVREETVFVVTSTAPAPAAPSPTAQPAPTNTAVVLAVEYGPQFLADCAFAQNTPGRRGCWI